MRRPAPRALLLDFDGVLRRFDPGWAADVERASGLSAGALAAARFAPDLLRAAVLGTITDERWRQQVAARVGDPAAVSRWWAYPGDIDATVLAAVRELRAGGVPVALASNATDRLDRDLAALGVAGEFDAVVNSSVLGVAKPAAEYYQAACRTLDTPPAECLLLDDSPRHVAGARSAGLLAHRYTGPADLAYLRAAFAR